MSLNDIVTMLFKEKFFNGYYKGFNLFVMFFIAIFLNNHNLFSQVNDTVFQIYMPDKAFSEDDLYQRLETISEEADYEIDYTYLIEELEYYARNPLNLNYAREEDLRAFFFLNNIQISNFLNHLATYGQLISIFELQAIDGWDIETIELIRPFVTVKEDLPRRHFTFDDMISEGNNQMFIRYHQVLEEQIGYTDIAPEMLERNPNARYLGSPYRLYSRYRYTYYNNISLGFTAQKNPGEEFFKGSQPYGFQFYSGHLLLRDFGQLKSLAIGDFQAQFGQGLALWSNLSFGKSYDAINIKKNPLGLRQYTSTDRNNFMRGIGSTVALGNFEVTGFVSYKKRDATVLEYDTISGETLSISSITSIGNARTLGELKNVRAVDETILGGNLTYKKPNFSLGATAYRFELSAPLKRNLSFFNQFDFNNQSTSNASVDYSYIFRNFNIFGEFAYSENGGYAIINGVMASLDPRFSVALLHRHISKDYQSLMGNAFTENTRVVNEHGIYLGLTARLSRKWNFYAYADHFSFPWMKWRTYAPSKGYDYLSQISYRPSRQVNMYLRYRQRNKPLNSTDESKIRYLDNVIQKNIRFNIGYNVTESVEFRNRFEVSEYEFGTNKQQGYLVYHDIVYRQLASPWAVTLRYALFDTDGYDSRIYAYEHNVLYAFGFPFYSDRGTRAYLLLRYKLSRNFDIWARYSQTFYANRNTIGNGLEMIEGNRRSEFTTQLRIKF